jgi:ABC-type Zn uptake system ZnuABC Zn-binding protein ZnuA
MKPVVLDTDVVSFLLKGDTRAHAYLPHLRDRQRIETADAWIAATALLYDAPLLTHNRKDYGGVPGLIFGG